MRKIILSLITLILTLIAIITAYLSIIGYETDKFNSFLENKITSNFSNTKIDFNKIKIKINLKNFSFFVTTVEPNIQFHNNEIKLKKIDAYVNLKSLVVGRPKIDKVNIQSNEIDIKKVKNITKYFKPSNLKKFILNEVEDGKTNFNLDLDLKDNKIENYEVNGTVKNFGANLQKIKLSKSSFVFLIKQDSGEIDNIRGNLNGFQINSGKVKFEDFETLKIKGSLNSDFNLAKDDLNNLIKEKFLQNLQNLKLTGKLQNLFEINFDKTLKVIDYQIESSGNLKKTTIEFRDPKNYLFIKNKIENLSLEKTTIELNLKKDEKKILELTGSYKINENLFQKFNLKYLFGLNLQQIYFGGDFDNEIDIPLLNFNTKNKKININTNIDFNKNSTNIKKFVLKDKKNKIDIDGLVLKKNKLTKFSIITVKTFKNKKLNNDFKISLNDSIKIRGTKYDASNLTKLIEGKGDTNFFKNISKEISIKIKKVSNNLSDEISNFSLIGNIDRGKFNKIVSKGEFKNGKYLDISLKVDKISKKKILEIYSDLPKPLLSNYKFFDGIIGGQLLLLSSYDSKNSNTNLIIENFKVKDAPGLVKLLSLADFGGMVDALSGDGLSFEKLEMIMEKNDKVLNLKELYAIGPSISILMEGYVETETGLVSLRGTMVPAKTLNKFLSKLPIVGDILIPKEIGEGLFGISFKMKGMPENIKTTVNPIKTLTPRFIQKALKKTK